jgi:hypothetical protein
LRKETIRDNFGQVRPYSIEKDPETGDVHL